MSGERTTIRPKDLLKKTVKGIIPKPLVDAAVRPAARAVLRAAFGRNGYNIDIGGQGTFRMSPDFVFRGWEDFGDRHNSGFAPCIQACRGKSVFLDVGAHIGLYSLPVSRVLGPGGQVFAFEPSDGNYRYLRQHMVYNGIENIRAYQLIVGDSTSDAVTFYEHLDRSSPVGGLIRSPKNPAHGDQFVETQMPQTCLDDFCAENDLAPDVIKIDVEGAELLVVQGAKRTLTLHRPLLFLSIHPSHLEAMGRSTEELATLLSDLGYEAQSTAGGPVDSLGSGEYIFEAVAGSRGSR